MAVTFWITIADGTLIRYDYDFEVAVSANDLRDLFNAGFYWYRAEIEGEFAFAYEYNELAPPEANQPVGTLSQEIIYYAQNDEQNDFVARVHQYLLPDEERDEAGQLKLGGSGLPDPKELLEDRILRMVRRRRRPQF